MRDPGRFLIHQEKRGRAGFAMRRFTSSGLGVHSAEAYKINTIQSAGSAIIIQAFTSDKLKRASTQKRNRLTSPGIKISV